MSKKNKKKNKSISYEQLPPVLDTIIGPDGMKTVEPKDYDRLAYEIRAKIVDAVGQSGGHLASNLGIVETTMALYKVFDLPKDKIVWDVGHQCYPHKILSGRQLVGLRQNGGISGFPRPHESDCDCVTAGHSSTSLSLALGLARARDSKGGTENVIAVIGDGALTGGMVFEALNDFGESRTKVIVILNDNKMSIAPNVGALPKYLARLRTSRKYGRLDRGFKRVIRAIPLFGRMLFALGRSIKNGFKGLVLRQNIFENFGFTYLGPFDGHDTRSLVTTLERAKKINGPVLLHIVTTKGRGYEDAELHPDEYHGVGPKCSGAVSGPNDFGTALGEALCKAAETDSRIVAVTAAMPQGTGLSDFSKRYRDRFYDVGIAEQHAVTMAAGLSVGGLKPYFAVYSTFLQRAYDQILHDVCIDNLPVTFCIDRAGCAGADGVTHQGVFDIAYLSQIPNMTVLAPMDLAELKAMVEWSVSYNAPLAIRYPKAASSMPDFDTGGTSIPADFAGSWQIVRAAQGSCYIAAVGSRMLAEALKTNGATIINARSVKPLDVGFLNTLGAKDTLITLEDGILTGGFGWAVRDYFVGKPQPKLITLGYEDSFVENYDVADTLKCAGLDSDSVQQLLDKAVGI